eukprot:PITA_29206
MGSSTHFLAEDKLCEKSDYHGWKMSLDLTLEEQEVLDHVRGRIVEPPLDESAAVRNKWTKGEVKARKIIEDSIDKRLVAYVSELTTSKEIYDRLVSLFKVNDANQVLFLRNMLKEIKKGKDETTLSTTAPPDSLGNWLIDSGASRHFTGYKEAPLNLVEKETNLEIVLGNNSKYPVKGVGNVTLQLDQGNTTHLQDLLYVPDLKKNLVSISTMEDKGHKVAFSDGKSKTWIYFLKKKDEVFSWFQHIKALIKNQIEKKIKILRTDNESNEFHDFCKEADIKRETTTPYTLEQNGVAESKNCTIVEAVYAMLHDQRLSKFLWAKAANTAVYVQNRCPHQALGSKTLEEMFTSKKLDVSHFTIFGSLVYFHVPKETMNKLGAFGKKGIFVGYSKNT